MREKPAERLVATNRRARHFFDIGETFEAGMELAGSEVKSLRQGWVDLKDSYGELAGGQLWLCKLFIKPYQLSAYAPVPERRRRLLVHREELNRLAGKVSQKGMSIVPLKLYFSPRGWAKVELGLGKGRPKGDRREDIKKRDAEREMRRVRGV